jgi:threonine/homoserine/homoserine lactone efflux protein
MSRLSACSAEKGGVMVSMAAVAGIAVVAFGFVCTPGPNMIYLVSRSIVQGRRAGMISLLGVAAGFAVYLLAAVAGLTAVFTLVPAAYTALKLAGAAYLLYLAWQAIRPGGRSPFAPQPLPPDSPRRLFTMGLVTNLLNPKIAVLYVSLLPQFVDPSRGDIALQNLLLGLTQIAVALTMNTVWICTAGGLAAFLAGRPTWLRVQRAFMATVLGGLAVKLATDRTRAVPA